MSIHCQNCGTGWHWDVILDDVPEGEEIFVHEHNDPDSVGVVTSYYCSVDCLTEANP